MAVPAARIRALNARPVIPAGEYVLYWMTSARRTRWNFGLERAAEYASELRRPLLVFEPLRCDYPCASDRLHRFVLDGMAANAAACARRGVTCFPYVEPAPGEGRGLLAALAASAAVVITDYSPAFFLPRMTSAAAPQVPVAFEAVDSNGIVPLAEAGRAFPTARGYRAFVQRTLRAHVRDVPAEEPLAALGSGPAVARVPAAVARRWKPADERVLSASSASLAGLPIDHRVTPVPTRGGEEAGRRTLRRFVDDRLENYADDHNHPDADVTSHLSPYLHFGHVSAHEVFSAVMTKERWTTRRLAARGGGAREGWWGTSASAEAFLDQLVVWREVAFNGAEWTPGFGSYAALPEWARRTLEAHRRDPRPHVYDRRTLERAATHDPVWNAAQRQLVRDGWFHGYLRMLWGKKILEWCDEPADALGHMEYLMNKYSLDGRDPVSSASYAWVLGQYDRPWPERPVFGAVRAMTSESAKRKLRMRSFLQKYS